MYLTNEPKLVNSAAVKGIISLAIHYTTNGMSVHNE